MICAGLKPRLPAAPDQHLPYVFKTCRFSADLRSRVVPRGWMPSAPPTGKSAAFCGLGNPASFWATLRLMGIEPCFRWSFDDHHQYRPDELQRLRIQAMEAGATVLLTTEKDWMNLPDGAETLLRPLSIRWLRIGIEVEDEAAFLALL